MDGYTDEELEAGMEEVAEHFGVFSTLDILSEGDPTQYKSILEIDADTIIRKLALEKARRRAEKRLQRIQQANAKQK